MYKHACLDLGCFSLLFTPLRPPEETVDPRLTSLARAMSLQQLKFPLQRSCERDPTPPGFSGGRTWSTQMTTWSMSPLRLVSLLSSHSFKTGIQRLLPPQETDYMGVIFHFYNSEDEDGDDVDDDEKKSLKRSRQLMEEWVVDLLTWPDPFL